MPASQRKTPTDRRPKAASKPGPKVATKASAWKGKSANALVDLELPSGNVCKVRRPGIPAMITQGLFTDSLMALATDAVNAGTGKVAKKKLDSEIDDIAKNPKMLGELMETFDRVTAYAVVEPECRYHRVQLTEGGPWTDIPLNERDEDVIYTDDVDLEDKSAIFSFVSGGDSNLETFRQQPDAAVDGLHAVEESSTTTE